MNGGRRQAVWLGVTCALLAISGALALMAPTEPLAERVRKADIIFVGKIVNRVVDGDWVRAELLVEEPLRNAKLDEKKPIIWRASISGEALRGGAEGTRGIALLTDQHEGRYWFRADKFEPLTALPEIKRLLAPANAPAQ